MKIALVALWAVVALNTLLGGVLLAHVIQLREMHAAQAELISEHAEIMQFWINQLDAQG
jgi:hypothetical protein